MATHRRPLLSPQVTSNSTLNTPVYRATPRPSFLIAISGSAETHKYTVATVLTEILKRATGESVTVASQSKFLKPMADCPAVRFRPGDGDRHFFKHVGPGASGLIDAHDRDCLAACRWEDLEAHVRGIKAGRFADIRIHEAEVEREMMLKMYAALVENGVRKLKGGIDSRFHDLAFSIRPAIVEGPTLFARSARSGDSIGGGEEDEDGDAGRLEGRMDYGIDFLPRDAVLKRKKLMALYDVKLFLGEDKKKVRTRTLSRCPRGEQVWTWDGYFHDVTWANYERYHEYILEAARRGPDTRVVDGVRIRPADRTNVAETTDVAETVGWAVDMIAAVLRERIEART